MAIDTILAAVGAEQERTERMANVLNDLAVPTGATVVLAHTFTEEDYDEVLDRLEYDPDDGQDVDEVASRHSATRAIARALDAEVDHEVRGAVGDQPGDLVVELAENAGADLVVVGGRKRSPTGKAVFGSTAQEVLLNAPCPVTFVRSE